jgi:hypothetical protein
MLQVTVTTAGSGNCPERANLFFFFLGVFRVSAVNLF